LEVRIRTGIEELLYDVYQAVIRSEAQRKIAMRILKIWISPGVDQGDHVGF